MTVRLVQLGEDERMVKDKKNLIKGPLRVTVIAIIFQMVPLPVY